MHFEAVRTVRYGADALSNGPSSRYFDEIVRFPILTDPSDVIGD